MATPEKICVSYKAAKAMYEAGIVVDDSLYSWHVGNAQYCVPVLKYSTDNRSGWDAYPAPTAEEFDLPLSVELNDEVWQLDIKMNDKGKTAYYYRYASLRQGVTTTLFLGGKPEYYAKWCEAFADAIIKLREAGYELGK